ncbi:hypothetical protein K432DRAFT_378015 [Lepidopterella palustris CBS 459.81]|uniref:Uncharacterized protein n=1 Tax=Lepidopterella palustris CBS 459.81 TaxID=1314670 RepID=A0A8E2EJP0_9PEZI|nr:hypothetical protein K432DRAFT_378015 [Lepidopterella palustris CBS 459.81]
MSISWCIHAPLRILRLLLCNFTTLSCAIPPFNAVLSRPSWPSYDNHAVTPSARSNASQPSTDVSEAEATHQTKCQFAVPVRVFFWNPWLDSAVGSACLLFLVK